ANNGPVCEGGALTLTGGPDGMSGYAWTGPDGFTSMDQNPTVSASATTAMAGDYTLVVTDANGCTGGATTTVVVNTNPATAIMASPGNTVCDGTPVTLDAGAGYSDYLWSTGETTQTIDVTTSDTYSVTVTDGNGCVGSNDISITVNSNPIATAANNGPVCEGGTLTLTGGPDGMTSYAWTGPDGYTSAEQSPTVSASATTAMAGDYTLVVTDANGCTGQAATPVVVALPPTADAGPDQTVGDDDVVTLAGTASNQSSITWSGGTGSFGPDANTLDALYIPSSAEIAAGTVTLTLTANATAPCTVPATDTMTIIITSAPPGGEEQPPATQENPLCFNPLLSLLFRWPICGCGCIISLVGISAGIVAMKITVPRRRRRNW
ncbi:MAG TPA: hypothetical protein VMV94_21535, partial [Phycisphaerae bacterium]|nr:hypothetical protein [Phycisphaerae bacterium]